MFIRFCAQWRSGEYFTFRQERSRRFFFVPATRNDFFCFPISGSPEYCIFAASQTIVFSAPLLFRCCPVALGGIFCAKMGNSVFLWPFPNFWLRNPTFGDSRAPPARNTVQTNSFLMIFGRQLTHFPGFLPRGHVFYKNQWIFCFHGIHQKSCDPRSFKNIAVAAEKHQSHFSPFRLFHKKHLK